MSEQETISGRDYEIQHDLYSEFRKSGQSQSDAMYNARIVLPVALTKIEAIKKQRDALEIIAVCTSGALEKAGFTEIDNPADAIEILAQQRDELIAVLQFILRGMDGGHIKCAPYFDFDPEAAHIEFKHPAEMIRAAISKATA